MLWAIQARMKPALSIIDLIPNVHRTLALAALRRAILDGRPATIRLNRDDKELAFLDAQVQLISPIGARVLKVLHDGGNLKLKKPAAKSLPALDAYIATEPTFRAEVAQILADEDTKRQRLAEIIADPDCAKPDEITPYLIDKVISARLGHHAFGTLLIAGLTCHREFITPPQDETQRLRAEGRIICWWQDACGTRHGDSA